MQINSVVFGPMDVMESQIYRMPVGPLGFEESRDFALIEKQDQDVTLRWLQAVDATLPCFVLFDPFELVSGYEPQPEEGDLPSLECKSPDELTYFVIGVVPEDITMTTVNLKSPIVINRRTNKARQVILQNDYPIRFPLVVRAEPAKAQ